MKFEYTVDFYHLLTGEHYMRSKFQSDADITSKEFDQELVNNVGMTDGWQEHPKHYVVVKCKLRTGMNYVRRHHFNSMHFKGIKKEEKL
ncbi:hypothetical protein LC76P1_00024 [Lysinibacillus phage LC76P1]|nr:hypothetical protein LC76P1_00024 [Lysinibacillus phage LC76P1]